MAVAGGAAIAAGPLMPFVTVTSPGVTMSPAQKGASVFFGLIVVALGFTLRVPPRTGRIIAGTAILGFCALAVFGYIGFIALGISGMPQQDALGGSFTVTFTPAIGIFLAIAGSAVAAIAAIRSFLHLPPPVARPRWQHDSAAGLAGPARCPGPSWRCSPP